MLSLRVLGALDATLDSGDRVVTPDLGGPRQRSVLALLLVARGRVVSVDRLVEDLWNGEAPPRAIGALQAYISHLRRALEPERAARTPATVLVSEPPGYAIRLPPDAVDAWRFEALVRRAAEPGQDARSLLQQALDLWRGPAFAEFETESWAATEAGRLEGLRTVARERWCETVLRAGAADEAVLAAEVLTREFPLREEGWRLLAMGLYATGRQADALAALRRARELLADELGLDPGPALLQVEADVLAQRLVVPTVSRHTPATPPADPPPAASDAPPRPATDDPEPSSFVGRGDELDKLHTAATEAQTRRDRRVALIAGEPGAGKSALLDRFAQELRSNGWRMVVGRCPESDGAPPAWAWVEVVRELAAEVDPGPQRAALAPLLEQNLRGDGRRAESDGSFGRFLLGRALVDYLATAAGSEPVAVLLDDLHRGDSETLALLDTVTAGTTGVPLLLVAAYRPAEVADGLRDALAGLAALPPLRLRLEGLDATHSARLIRAIAGQQPDAATVAALVERTAGNPFYLAESARLLGSEGGLIAVAKVPEGVRDVLRRRFARLPELTVSILRLAAVIGRDVDIDVLVRAAEVDEDTVLDALEAGVLAGLLSEPEPGRVRFAHVLVRDTLYEDAPRLRRSRWHGRIADAVLAVHPEDAAALAYHYHQAATTATARDAVDAAVRAAETALARYAHETAAELYEQALRDLDRVPVGQARPPAPGPRADVHLAERVDLLARLSRCQLAAGATVDSLASRRRAMQLADAGGRTDLLIHAIVAKDLPTPWMTRSYGSVDHEMITLIERALASADPIPDDETRCRLLYSLIIEVADRERSVRLAQEAERLARGLRNPVLIGLILHAWVASVDVEVGIDKVREVGRELVEIGGRPGLAVFALIGHHCLARVACVHGDAAAMTEHVQRVSDLVRRFRWRQAAALEHMMRGTIAHLTGRLDDAEADYLRATGLLMDSGHFDAAGIRLLAVLTVRVTQWRTAELVEILASLDTEADALARDLRSVPLLAAGRREEAARLRAGLPPVPHDFFRSLVLTFRGMAAAGLGDPVEAAAVERDLLDYRGQIGGGGTGSFVIGPVDTVIGDLAATLGRQEDAREFYRSALDLAERCGNDPWAEQARRRLAGGRPEWG